MFFIAEKQESMSRPRRFKRIKGGTKKLRRRLTVRIYVLPNLLTTMNMFFGFFAIIHGIKGNFPYAAYAIVAASVFDLLDGRVARMTCSTSKFGAQYDSLCDLVSFGIAPGLLLFQWSLQPFGRIGWLASFFYVTCGALRLARFSVQQDVIEKNYFQGLPIPMAAGIVASSVLAFQDLSLAAHRSPWILAMTFLLGFVMVSTFRYRSFKDIDLKHRLPFTYLVMGVFILALIAIRPEVMFFVLFLTYATLGAIFGTLRLGRPLKKPAPNFLEESSQMSAKGDLHEEVEEDA